MVPSVVKRGAIIALIGACLAACGTRGSLESPASDDKAASAESGQGKKEGEAPKPHRGFILDGLIR
jgi:predicted small lipoprotein YifL